MNATGRILNAGLRGQTELFMSSLLDDFIADELNRRTAIAAAWWDRICFTLGTHPLGITRDQYIIDVIVLMGPICFTGASTADGVILLPASERTDRLN